MLVSIPENTQGETIAGANARARLSKDHKGKSTEREGGRRGKWKVEEERGEKGQRAITGKE
jgi:hypothetical protein